MYIDLIVLISINLANYKLDNASEKYKLPLLNFACFNKPLFRFAAFKEYYLSKSSRIQEKKKKPTIRMPF